MEIGADKIYKGAFMGNSWPLDHSVGVIAEWGCAVLSSACGI